MSNEHITLLTRTRAKLVEDRRAYAARLAGHGEREEMERWRRILVDIQNTITAVDKAIADEAKLGPESL